MSKPFIHLHVHTEMSLLDGAARITKGKKSPLMDACKAKNMPAIAITDHGVMYGVFTFQKLAVAAEIEPIIGCEMYMCDNMYDKSSKEMYHILLLAKNDIGYRNLVKMDSIGFTEGFYYKPRIDLEFLRRHSEGIICTSACIGGMIPQLLIKGEYEKAKEYAIQLRDIFAPGDFYIEIQDHGIPEERMCNPLLVKIAREIGVKVVATNDVHYLEKEDAQMHDVLLCIQTRKTIDDPNRMRFSAPEFYLKTYEEMEELFGWCPEALQTPFEIAQKCHVRIEKHDLMPPYTPENGQTPAEFLRDMAFVGLVDRYGEITEEIRSRAEYELDIIIKMGFAEYYLIVWDFIDYARRSGIPVGAGRGSGVGSIIAYAIGITNVNPLKYNLLFERFLNPERVSNPDFDIDFCVDGRGQVIDYVIDKYGAEKVCQILALGTMATKNAIKDVARVYKIPLNEVNRLTKLIPGGKVHLDELLGLSDNKTGVIPELVEAYENDDQMRKVLDLAMQIEGMPRNCSKHAAGVVICKEVISDFVPLSRSGQDITTQFQKEEVEEVGMLKMDFLGLRTLTDIKKAKDYVLETTGNVVDFAKLGYDDPNVYKLIGTGETDAVFQLESPGMKKFMKDLQPENLEDIIAGISLYRPGPMDSIPKYVAAKKNPATISYDHPLLEPILDMTYGCIVYQEQVMQIVQALSGYTYGRADVLRRAMGKKKKDVMAKEREIFIHGTPAADAVYNKDGSIKIPAMTAVEGALNRGVPEDIANKLFDDMEAFASYAFNKSHAAAYAVVAYETAYLKCYYPVQFIAAVINNRINNQDEIAKYVEYLRNTGVKIYPPDINKSNVYFTVENGGLRYGLMGIKNVGEAAIQSVVDERIANGEFIGLSNLLKRTEGANINKRLIESLIKGGALDCFNINRATLLANYENIMLINNYDKVKRSMGQLSLFGLLEEEEEPELRQVPEYPKNELLIMEKDMLNVYMTGHPLEEYRKIYATMPFNLSYIKPLLRVDNDNEEGGDEESQESAEESVLVKEYDKRSVELGGLLSDIRIRVTKTNKSMAMAKLEDLYGIIDIVMFPKVYDKYNHLLVKDNILVVSGELQVKDRPQIVVNSIKKWSLNDVGNNGANEEQDNRNTEEKDDKLLNVKNISKLCINANDCSEDEVKEIISILREYSGNLPCYIKHKGRILNSGEKVRDDKLLYLEVASIVGEDNCKPV